jgi:hypothetical protein
MSNQTTVSGQGQVGLAEPLPPAITIAGNGAPGLARKGEAF